MTENTIILKEITLLDGTVYHGVKYDIRANVPAGFIGVRQSGKLIMINSAHIVEVHIDELEEEKLGLFDWFPHCVQVID